MKVMFGEQAYVRLNNDTIDSFEKLTDLEKQFKGQVGHITDFLNNQEDFDLLHKSIMQRVHKEELIELQAKKEEISKRDKLNESSGKGKKMKAKVTFNLEDLVVS